MLASVVVSFQVLCPSGLPTSKSQFLKGRTGREGRAFLINVQRLRARTNERRTLTVVANRQNVRVSHLRDERAYAQDGRSLQDQVAKLFSFSDKHFKVAQCIEDRKLSAKAIIVPHANMYLSGACAASAYHELRNRSKKIERVVMLAPSHYESFRGVALPDFSEYEIPSGSMWVDVDVMRWLRQHYHPLFKVRPEAWEPEHAVEIQLPFLQYILGNDIGVVPLIVSDFAAGDLDKVSEVLAQLLQDESTVAVVSADFVHYGGHFDFTPFSKFRAARIKSIDATAVDAILRGSVEQFERSCQDAGDTICGRNPIRVLLRALHFLLNPNDRPSEEEMRFDDRTFSGRGRVHGGSSSFDNLGRGSTFDNLGRRSSFDNLGRGSSYDNNMGRGSSYDNSYGRDDMNGGVETRGWWQKDRAAYRSTSVPDNYGPGGPRPDQFLYPNDRRGGYDDPGMYGGRRSSYNNMGDMGPGGRMGGPGPGGRMGGPGPGPDLGGPNDSRYTWRDMREGDDRDGWWQRDKYSSPPPYRSRLENYSDSKSSSSSSSSSRRDNVYGRRSNHDNSDEERKSKDDRNGSKSDKKSGEKRGRRFKGFEGVLTSAYTSAQYRWARENGDSSVYELLVYPPDTEVEDSVSYAGLVIYDKGEDKDNKDEPKPKDRLSSFEKLELMAIVRRTILTALNEGIPRARPFRDILHSGGDLSSALLDWLLEPAPAMPGKSYTATSVKSMADLMSPLRLEGMNQSVGAVVSLTPLKRGVAEKRCGALEADVPLYELLPQLALGAAFDDPRNGPIHFPAKLKEYAISIALLFRPTKPIKVDEADVSKFGLVVSKNGGREVQFLTPAEMKSLDIDSAKEAVGYLKEKIELRPDEKYDCEVYDIVSFEERTSSSRF